MVNMQQIMKQAQAMQEKMMELQEKLAQTEYQGTAGGGMVTVSVSGKGTLKKVVLDKTIIDPEDKEVLEDLIVAAFNDAKKKADDATNDGMASMASGLGLPPGMKLPF